MLHLKDVLQKRMRQNNMSEKVTAAQIVQAAQEILLEVFPENLVGRMAAAYIKDKTLTIKVESPAVGQEVKFHEMDILSKLCKKIPTCGVERIRFSL